MDRLAWRTGARERGFTLIELLVVILIIAALAAIAFPAFINQRGKADDAAAKGKLATAQRAMETYFVERGSYASANMNPAPDQNSLMTIEPTLADPPTPTIPRRNARSYTLRVVSASQTPVIFRLRRQTSSRITRTCTPPSTGGCSATGTW